MSAIQTASSRRGSDADSATGFAGESDMLRVVVFRLDDQHYALPVSNVVELLRAVATSPLPKAPAVVEGVIDLRGQIIPVLDIRRRFHLPARRPAHTDHLLIADTGGRKVAIRVDAALDLVAIPRGELSAASQISPGVGYVTHVARWSDSLILIHDLATFLTSAEAAEIDHAIDADRQGAHP